MITYNYRAMNDSARQIRGQIAAENELDLEARLKQLGLELLSYKEVKSKKAGALSKVKMKDMIILCLHLEQLNRAGVPLLDAIADVRDSTESPKLKDILAGVYESIKTGETYSNALANYPKVFNEIFVGLIRAGEKTGDLTEAYKQLADHMKWNSELQRKVKKAATYPIVLLVVMSAVITILMVFVVPKLIKFITSQGFEIPIHTRALIATSNFMVDYWYVIFGFPVITFIILTTIYRTSESFAYKCDDWLLRAPVFGNIARKINMSRFTHFFAIMYNSGIDILEALDSAKNVLTNRVLRESMVMVRRSVTDGTSLTNSLRLSSQFPNLVVRMFKVGEDSGNIGDALENITYFYDREVNDGVERVVGLVQPTLTAVMGLLIFWVISSVFGPLYQSFSKMNF